MGKGKPKDIQVLLGMVSEQNLLALVNRRYIFGHRGQRDKDAKRWLSKLTDR